MSEIAAEHPPHMEPSHPGSLLREDVLPALGLAASDAARQLGVSRQKLQAILDERAPVTPEMASGSASSVATAPPSGCVSRAPTTSGTPSARSARSSPTSPATRPDPPRLDGLPLSPLDRTLLPLFS
jgi:addiction module HigA family antidote